MTEQRSVVVFGGAGFIGCNWCSRLLLDPDAEVTVFDNLSRRGVQHNLEWLRQLAGNSGRLQVVTGDVRDVEAVEHVTRRATEIYHLAAQVAVTTSVADPRHDMEVNLCGTFNVLEGARHSGLRPFVLFTSTNKVYGEMGQRPMTVTPTRYRYQDDYATSESDPLDFHSPYGCSKGAADQYVRDYARIYGLPATVFRMSCIAGPRQFGNEDQGWVAHFLYSALHGRPVTIYGDGRQVRDILAVDDLMRAFEAARTGREATAGEIFNVGGGRGNTASLLELMAEIEAVTGRRLECGFDEPRAGDQLIYITDTGKLRQATGWQPQLGVRQTLESIYGFWKSHRRVFEAQYGPAMEPLPPRASQPTQVAS